MAAPVDYASHSAYSDPGRWAELLDATPTDPAALSAVARNVIAHYRANADELPEATRHEIGLRWLADILGADQSRNSGPLDTERPMASRVQGCCRDHTLLCVGALRQHGIPARSRVGFASYFRSGWNHDHVIVDVQRDGRWVRFDSELVPGAFPFDTLDIPAGPDAPFVTAAEAWQGHQSGRIDVETFGVDVDSPVRGEWFVRTYVVMELAHRFKDELLLWDGWGVMGPEADEDTNALIDELAALLVAADAGDDDAEAELRERYETDQRLAPGERIQSFSPYGEITDVVLTR
jgi:Transglutaminase-like superfamily